MKRLAAIVFWICLGLGWLCCSGYGPAAGGDVGRNVLPALPEGLNPAAAHTIQAMRVSMSLYEAPAQMRLPAAERVQTVPGCVCEYTPRPAAFIPPDRLTRPQGGEFSRVSLPGALRSVYGLRKIIV